MLGFGHATQVVVGEAVALAVAATGAPPHSN
jgi:hypothetical protein